MLKTDEEILGLIQNLKKVLGDYGIHTLMDWLILENTLNIIPLLPKECRIVIKAGHYSKLERTVEQEGYYVESSKYKPCKGWTAKSN